MTQKGWAIIGLGIAVGFVLFALGDRYSDNALLESIGQLRDFQGTLLIVTAIAWIVGSFCLGIIFGGKKTGGQIKDDADDAKKTDRKKNDDSDNVKKVFSEIIPDWVVILLVGGVLVFFAANFLGVV